MNAFLRLAAAATILLCRPAIASPVEYTVDSSASFVTVSGSFAGSPFSEQTPGSSITHYGGHFLGDLENGLLALDANSTVSFFQPIPQQPLPTSDNGGLGAYGFRVTNPNLGEVLIAISGISFYLTTNFDPPLDVGDGFFAPADVGFFLRGDTLLLSGDTFALTYVDLHGTGAPNQAAQPGTFTTNGQLETLTIPILTTFSLTALSSDDLSLTLTGQIVATRPVPEPSTALLLFCGGGLLIRNAGRRIRARR